MSKSNDTPLGTVTNTLSNGGAGGGMGSKVVNENAPYILERPTFWKNPHEASARRGQARGADGTGKSDVGGR